MSVATVVFLVAVCILTLVAAAWDLKTRKLPNWLTVSGLVGALAYHGVTSGWAGLVFSLGGFATGFSILLVLWLIGGGGAGDVKLMGALGAWLGAMVTLYVFILSAMLVLVGYTVWLMVQIVRWLFGLEKAGAPQRSMLQILMPRNKEKKAGAQATKKRRGAVLPFAVPVALSTWLVLFAWKLWNLKLFTDLALT